jgi:4-hydroxybenzoate polyprenyltransferase
MFIARYLSALDGLRMTTLAGYVRLIHVWPVLAVMLATASFGALAADGEILTGRFALLLVGMLAGQVALGAHNEWLDADADAIHQPYKPIPSGIVPRRAALAIVPAGLLVMLAAGAALGFWPLLLLAAGTGCGVIYNLKLKRTALSWLPYLLALPLIPTWAWLVMDGFEPRLLILYLVGAPYVLAIHLAQTLPDVEGDRARGERGLAVVLGRERARAVIWLLALGSAALALAGALLLLSRPLPAALASVVVLLMLGLIAYLDLDGNRFASERRFELLTFSAILLGVGWVIGIAS